jgi:4-hydroxy-2-oxoheptanedioate aldolase
MRKALVLWSVGLVLTGSVVLSDALASRPMRPAQDNARLNPVIELLEQGKPVFGVYAPRNARGRGRGPGRGADGQEAPPATPERTPADLAREAVGYRATDFLFDGSMEGGLERALPAFTAFTAGWTAAGALVAGPTPRLTHPLIVKSPELEPGAAAGIHQQLALGVSGIMFPTVESADQLREALAAMRFESQGGTRPDDALGNAPARWGMSADAYRRKADLWPLEPQGELINWTIIESQAGLDNIREIAAVPGIGVLWPGAGTLRGLFSTTNAAGERVLDEAAWEAAIQKVLAACQEFDIPCGFPAGPDNIEMRMQQGFRVFVMNWGDAGFETIDIGRRVAGR